MRVKNSVAIFGGNLAGAKISVGDKLKVTVNSAQLFPQFVGADARIAEVNRMNASQLRQVLGQTDLQRSVRSCAAVRLQRLEQTELARLKEAGR